MKTFFLKAGTRTGWIGSLLFLFSGMAFAGENGLSSNPLLAPPIPGLDGPYLGTVQVVRVDGERLPVIRGKRGVSIFRLKLVDSKQPFMARTVVRFIKHEKGKHS